MDHCKNDFLKSTKPSIGNYSQCWTRASRNTNLPQPKPRATAAEGNESPQENSLHLPRLLYHLLHITYSFWFSASPAGHLCHSLGSLRHWNNFQKSEFLEILGWNRITNLGSTFQAISQVYVKHNFKKPTAHLVIFWDTVQEVESCNRCKFRVRVSQKVIEETDITLRALTDYVSNPQCSALSPISNYIRMHTNRIQHIQQFTGLALIQNHW